MVGSLLKRFRNFVLAIVLIITVYKILYYYSGGSQGPYSRTSYDIL